MNRWLRHSLPIVLSAALPCAQLHADSLPAFTVFSHDARIFADRPWGVLETTGSRPWDEDKTGHYYLRPQEVPGLSDAALAQALKSLAAPGVDWSGQPSMDDARLSAILGPLGDGGALRFLSIQNTRVSDRSAPLLHRLKTLEVLRLSDQTTDATLRALKLPRLQELQLGHAPVSAAGLSALAQLKTLRRLDVSQARVAPSALKLLSRFTLDQLALGREAGDDTLRAVARLRTLGSLDLSATRATDKGLAPLAALKHLHTLFLPPTISDAGVSRLRSLSALRRLDLSSAPISDAAVNQLSHLSNLEEVSLADTAVTDAILPALKKLPKLRTLDLRGTRLTRAALRELSLLPALQVLALPPDASIQLADLKALGILKNLRTLWVNGKPVSVGVLTYVKASTGPPADSALAFSSAEKASWPDTTPASSLPSETLRDLSPRGLSGLKGIHQMESELDHVVPAVETAKIESRQDTQANFLGDIQVGAPANGRHQK